MISDDVKRLVTAALHYRAAGGQESELLLYADVQREVVQSIEDSEREAEDVIDELVNLTTTAFIRMAETTGQDALSLWRTVALQSSDDGW